MISINVDEQLRDVISAFLKENFDLIKADLVKLRPKDRARLYCILLQYGLPRLRNVPAGIDYESMTDVQLDMIIEGLKKSLEEREKKGQE